MIFTTGETSLIIALLLDTIHSTPFLSHSIFFFFSRLTYYMAAL